MCDTFAVRYEKENEADKKKERRKVEEAEYEKNGPVWMDDGWIGWRTLQDKGA